MLQRLNEIVKTTISLDLPKFGKFSDTGFWRSASSMVCHATCSAPYTKDGVCAQQKRFTRFGVCWIMFKPPKSQPDRGRSHRWSLVRELCSYSDRTKFERVYLHNHSACDCSPLINDVLCTVDRIFYIGALLCFGVSGDKKSSET